MAIQKKAVAIGISGLLVVTGPAMAEGGTNTGQADQAKPPARTSQASTGQSLNGKLAVPDMSLQKLRGRGTSADPEQEQSRPVGQAPSKEAKKQPDISSVSNQPGVLTPRGHFALDPSLEYTYSSNSQVTLIGYTVVPAITVGLINVSQVNNSTIVAALTGRYGITNRLEFESKVPFVYRDSNTVTRPQNTGGSGNVVYSATGRGVGDIEAALRYQFNQGGPGVPYVIGTLRAIFPTGRGPFSVPYLSTEGSLIQETLPTGAGFWSVQPGINVIFPSDPAVFFGGVSYLYNFARDVNKTLAPGSYVGRVNPGDEISFNFGMGLALNDRSSFSLGYQHVFIRKSSYNGHFPTDETTTQLGQLLFGYAYAFTSSTSLNVSLGAGLTRDTPDVDLTIRVPMQF